MEAEASQSGAVESEFDPPLKYSLILVVCFVVGSWLAQTIALIPFLNSAASALAVLLMLAGHAFAFIATPMAAWQLSRHSALLTGPNILLTCFSLFFLIRIVYGVVIYALG